MPLPVRPVLCALLFCLCIVGCGGKPEASAPMDPKDKQSMEDMMKKSTTKKK